MVLDEKSAERLYNRLRSEKSDEGTYKIAFENESGAYKDILSPGNRWLTHIINKNKIATDNSIKLIETSLTEIGVEASTQTGGLSLRELDGLDRELRTISGSLRSAIARSMAKQVDIDKEKIKLEEMANDETYSEEQREEVRARLQRFQDEQKAINNQIHILKGRYSNQIYQIRESIMKFLDKETGTLGERIRTLFKEQGITIVSILTALGMTLGVLIEALLGGPTVSTTTSQSTTTTDKKGGAREWIKNKLKALSQLPGKLADKALASLPGIIGSIISWILNRAKEVIGWLSSTLLTFPSCQAIFHQHQPMVSMHLSSFAMPVVAQIILIF